MLRAGHRLQLWCAPRWWAYQKGPVERAAAALWILLAAFLFAPHARGQSGNHGEGHAQQHDIYKSWRIPTNPMASCCHNEDCRPTRAFIGKNGLWLAWNGERWLEVPDAALLPQDLAEDGRNHLCEKGGHVYCFTPGKEMF